MALHDRLNHFVSNFSWHTYCDVLTLLIPDHLFIVCKQNGEKCEEC